MKIIMKPSDLYTYKIRYPHRRILCYGGKEKEEENVGIPTPTSPPMVADTDRIGGDVGESRINCSYLHIIYAVYGIKIYLQERRRTRLINKV